MVLSTSLNSVQVVKYDANSLRENSCPIVRRESFLYQLCTVKAYHVYIVGAARKEKQLRFESTIIKGPEREPVTAGLIRQGSIVKRK